MSKPTSTSPLSFSGGVSTASLGVGEDEDAVVTGNFDEESESKFIVNDGGVVDEKVKKLMMKNGDDRQPQGEGHFRRRNDALASALRESMNAMRRAGTYKRERVIVSPQGAEAGRSFIHTTKVKLQLVCFIKPLLSPPIPDRMKHAFASF